MPRGVAPNGFPPRSKGTLTYIQMVNLDPGAGLTYNTWNLNSLYDPDQTGTGHQPMGFDSWATLYSRYMVESADVTVKLHSSAGSTTPVICGICPYTGSTPYSSSTITMGEQAAQKIIVTGTRLNNGSDPNTLTYHFDASKFFGIPRIDDDQSELGALTNASPTRRAYLQLFLGPADESTDLAVWYAVVEFKFHAVFYDPLQQGSN